MRALIRFFSRIGALLLSLYMLLGSVQGFTPSEFIYERAYGNPMKGFMPFYGEGGVDSAVEHSMEWFYIPLSALVTDDGEYRIAEGLEPYLDDISSRGNQAVFRVYLDYPADKLGDKAVSQFIWDMGVKKLPYDGYGGGVSPDYSDDRLIDFLVDFVHEFGKACDGDSRIAYITTGLIGHWGEWHFSACPEAAPSREQQARVIAAFAESFTKTHVLTRYPGTPGTESGKLGYHDDSFAYETINSENKWEFVPRLRRAHQLGIWRTQPIGGEFRPECQLPYLTGGEYDGMQPYDECVKQTHCSWLIMQRAFDTELTAEQVKAANEASASLGYDFFVSRAAVKRVCGKTKILVAVKNTGVAPIYADPAVFIGTADGEVRAEGCALSELMPGETEVYTASLEIRSGDEVHIRIGSPAEGGKPVRFSNKGCAEDGSLVLGALS